MNGKLAIQINNQPTASMDKKTTHGIYKEQNQHITNETMVSKKEPNPQGCLIDLRTSSERSISSGPLILPEKDAKYNQGTDGAEMLNRQTAISYSAAARGAELSKPTRSNTQNSTSMQPAPFPGPSTQSANVKSENSRPPASIVNGVVTYIREKLSPADSPSIEQQFLRMTQEISQLKKTVSHKDAELAKYSEVIQRVNHAQEDILAHLEVLQVDNKGLEAERNLAKAELDRIVRAHQEQSFKHIESGLWTPRDDSKVKADLESLKRAMRNVTKEIAASSFPNLADLTEESQNTVKAILGDVIRWDYQKDFLVGISTEKICPVILNALLAHRIYSQVINSPFFFVQRSNGASNPLTETHEMALKANKKDAHAWRSQTLRLLYPQMSSSNSDQELALRQSTEKLISDAATLLARRFAKGPASVFFAKDFPADVKEKIAVVYIQAARISYELWTRRTAVECYFLRDTPPDFGFNVNDPQQLPHTLVRFEDHKDELKDQPVKMFVHPMMKVYGTDEGEEYEKGRIWMRAEVWLPSREHARK